MKILAIIPAHNEAKNIAAVVTSVKALGHAVLVVDDGSSDATADLATNAKAEVISTGQKSGKGNALRLGFDYAVRNNFSAVIALDGDGQHSSGDIAVFIQCYEKTKADIINGNRMRNPVGMPAVRLVTNAFMSWLISLICRQPIPDTQCGFRLIQTDVLKNIQLECTDFEIETELLIKASRKQYKIASVPIATIYRGEISKIRPVHDTLRFIRYIIQSLLQK